LAVEEPGRELGASKAMTRIRVSLVSLLVTCGVIAYAPEAAAAKTVSVSDVSVNESDTAGTMTFTILLSKKSTRTVKVDYQTAAGTATAGTDYTTKSGTARIKPGKKKALVSVPIIGDNLSEFAETLTLTLSNPVRAVVGDGTSTGTIVDDEQHPNLIISEFLASAAGDDFSEEFLEIHNMGGEPVDLSNVQLRRNTGLGTLISCVFTGSLGMNEAHVGSPNVLIRDTNCLPALPSTGEIYIAHGDFIFDIVAYPAQTTGRSRNLDPESYSFVDNDVDANWCLSTGDYDPTTNTGNPGTINAQCP
jgi:hypothetical protein